MYVTNGLYMCIHVLYRYQACLLLLTFVKLIGQACIDAAGLKSLLLHDTVCTEQS